MDQYYLLGYPIEHSKSPAIHNTAFKALGIDACYGLRECDETTLADTVAKLKEEHVSGWNVTMPCKHVMALLCDELSPAAKAGGSVNTVLNKDGYLYGYTTDGIGFANAAKESGYPVKDAVITLLGTGGAAAPILIQAALSGAAKIHIFYNRPESGLKTRKLVEILKADSETDFELHTYKEAGALRNAINASNMLVNATNVGMTRPDGTGGGSLIPDGSYLSGRPGVFDVIYNPAETPLLKMAREKGLTAENGIGMLIGQAAESFRIWTGRDMPIDLVRRTVFPG